MYIMYTDIQMHGSMYGYTDILISMQMYRCTDMISYDLQIYC